MIKHNVFCVSTSSTMIAFTYLLRNVGNALGHEACVCSYQWFSSCLLLLLSYSFLLAKYRYLTLLCRAEMTSNCLDIRNQSGRKSLPLTLPEAPQLFSTC